MKKESVLRPTALVTGGAQRIGQAICYALARSGYKIALHYGHSAAEARQTAQHIRENGGVCAIFPCDLSDKRAVENLLGRVLKKFSRIDVLINNASVFEPSSLKKDEHDAMKRHFAVNFHAPYILMRSFARRAGEGSIINILDTHIVRDKTSHSAYLLSKKALAELTKMAAVEFAPGVRVNAVAPGLILPPASPEGGPANQNPGYLERLAKDVPLKRKGRVANVTDAVLFLLDNDYVTGQIIYADGGEHLI
ncbi:MAG: SDR family oxidoreductase [Candidatus Omnitrophica bacterium]|nr:SDR family oxidoreductase [Candidatus Omnitrophota bacterium]